MKSKVAISKQLVKLISSAGNDARNLRDAAHEAAHALQMNIPKGQWERDSIHDALCTQAREFSRGKRDSLQQAHNFLWRSEIYARAVEQIVCRDLNIPTDPVEVWANNAFMEASMMGIQGLTLAQLGQKIHKAMKTKTVRKLADRVMALVGKQT